MEQLQSPFPLKQLAMAQYSISEYQSAYYNDQQKNSFKDKGKPNRVYLILIILHRVLNFFKIKKTVVQTSDSELSDNSNLLSELDSKKKELMAKNIQLSQQNEVIKKIKVDLENLRPSTNEQLKLNGIISSIRTYKLTSNWIEFELYFNEIHTGFYDQLNIMYPHLTVNERRLCGLIYLNLTSKEISLVTGKTVRSIEVARCRMRKKMKLDKSQSLIVGLPVINQSERPK